MIYAPGSRNSRAVTVFEMFLSFKYLLCVSERMSICVNNFVKNLTNF